MHGWKQLGTFKALNIKKDTFLDDTDFLLEIIKPYIYVYNDVEYASGEGDVTDGASIPDELEEFAGSNFEVEEFAGTEDYKKLVEIKKRIKTDSEILKKFIKFVNSRGRYIPAAFIHDKLCQLGLSKKAVCSWEDAHKIFYYAMLDNGVPKFCGFLGLGGAWVKYQAVKLGMLLKKWDH